MALLKQQKTRIIKLYLKLLTLWSKKLNFWYEYHVKWKKTTFKIALACQSGAWMS